MSERQLQIQFPRPGVWEEFTMTAVYRDAEGYIRTDRYTQKEIPSNYLEAFAGVVSVLCVLSDDWQARQVWACLHDAPALEEEAACLHPHIIRSSRLMLIPPWRFSSILPGSVTVA